MPPFAEEKPTENLPAVLAPAGSRESFLAALAAGAEAVYCGLKQFTARVEARNFTLEELAALVELAHAKGTRVFVTLNSLIKPDELTAAGRLLDRLNTQVLPDAVIVQDLAMAQLVRQTGFAGQVIWSTLANITSPAALRAIRDAVPADGLVLPRELSIDEIKRMAAACPPGLALEVFVHGALCYGVSGRCYWSSFLGGKSGLRGRCVQPCRRIYTQQGRELRYFSCLDLSVDVLVKILLGVPQIRAWKIEGRKKGPHYVYYIVTGYRLLRDHGREPQAKKDGLYFIGRALGRPGTHYYFLPQRRQVPIDPREQTGSGLLIGRTQGPERRPAFIPRLEMLPGDLLRIGYEDAPGHRLERIGRALPKGGRFVFPPAAGPIAKGTAVFLIDRREKALEDRLQGLAAELPSKPPRALRESSFRVQPPRPARLPAKIAELRVVRALPPSERAGRIGLWLGAAEPEHIPPPRLRSTWWWLPPVVFPDAEEHTLKRIQSVWELGGRTFVLNAPWQAGFFSGLAGARLWAGPFCNLANPLALETAAALGMSGAIVSPELGGADYRMLPAASPLPLGIVVSGNWPLCIARTASGELGLERPFRSPKGEEAWAAQYDTLTWVFPNWRLDLSEKKGDLQRAGYCLFIHLEEPVPKGVKIKIRPGLWGWETGMM
jgi:putative protease